MSDAETAPVDSVIVNIARDLAPALIVLYGRYASQKEIEAELAKSEAAHILSDDELWRVAYNIRVLAQTAEITVTV